MPQCVISMTVLQYLPQPAAYDPSSKYLLRRMKISTMLAPPPGEDRPTRPPCQAGPLSHLPPLRYSMTRNSVLLTSSSLPISPSNPIPSSTTLCLCTQGACIGRWDKGAHRCMRLISPAVNRKCGRGALEDGQQANRRREGAGETNMVCSQD